MTKEQELAEQLKQLQELAKENKNIDVTALMANAMQAVEENYISSKQKRIAYLVSLAFPPFGLIFALKYWLSDKKNGGRVALVCVILTVVTILSFYIIVQMVFSSSGLKPQDLQQLSNPQTIQGIFQ